MLPHRSAGARAAGFSLLAGVLIAGCASSYVPLSAAKPAPAAKLLAFQTPAKDSGKIVVIRDEGFAAGGCDFGFHVDGNLAGRLATGEMANFFVPAGEHTLGVGAICPLGGSEPPREIETLLRIGQTKNFRLGQNSEGELLISPVSVP